MAIVLLEHTADARDMLNCKLEQYQGHGCLADLVVVLQVAGRREETQESGTGSSESHSTAIPAVRCFWLTFITASNACTYICMYAYLRMLIVQFDVVCNQMQGQTIARRTATAHLPLHHVCQCLEICHFVIHLHVSTRQHVVPKEETSHVFVREGALWGQVAEQLVQAHLELLLCGFSHDFKQPLLVFLINESVREDPVHLMDPEADELVSLGQMSLRHQQSAKHHSSKVSQVEHIMRLGWRGQELVHTLLVHIQGCHDYHLEGNRATEEGGRGEGRERGGEERKGQGEGEEEEERERERGRRGREMKGEGGKRRQAPWLHQHGQDVGEARHTVPCTCVAQED